MDLEFLKKYGKLQGKQVVVHFIDGSRELKGRWCSSFGEDDNDWSEEQPNRGASIAVKINSGISIEIDIIDIERLEPAT